MCVYVCVFVVMRVCVHARISRQCYFTCAHARHLEIRSVVVVHNACTAHARTFILSRWWCVLLALRSQRVNILLFIRVVLVYV